MIQIVVVKDDKEGKILVEKKFRDPEAAKAFGMEKVEEFTDNEHVSVDLLTGETEKAIRRNYAEVFA